MYVYAIPGTVAIDSALTIRDRQKNCPKIPGGKGNHFFGFESMVVRFYLFGNLS